MSAQRRITPLRKNIDVELALTESMSSTGTEEEENAARTPLNNSSTPHLSRSVRSINLHDSPELLKDTQIELQPTKLRGQGYRTAAPTMVQKMIAEAVGTALLVFFGCGSVCASVYTEDFIRLGQSTTIWSLGTALALFCVAPTSGGHLNPAVTLSFALIRRQDFSCKMVLPYWIAQLLGAFAGGMLNFVLFYEAIAKFEAKNDITRGTNSIASATGFGVYPT